MAIVDWGDFDVEVGKINPHLEEDMMYMRLKNGENYKPWVGSTKYGTHRNPFLYSADKCRVELRKSFQGAQVLIRVGHVDEHEPRRWGTIDRNSDVTIGTSGKMHMTAEEALEMYLAIDEARTVLNNHLKKLEE